MADQWNDNIPTLGGTINTQYPDIEENFGWIQRLLMMLIGYKTSDIATVSPPGPQRSKFDYSSTTAIVINPGVYFHDGTTRQTVFWDAAITFTAGSGGSNAGSTDLGVSQQHYLYLDDSAIITQASPELDADCFLNSTTAPTWSDAKHGWYNGSDKCIFGFRTNGSSQIIEFIHDGGEAVFYADELALTLGALTGTGTWDDCTVLMPGFAIKALISFHTEGLASDATVSWRTNGQTGTTGHKFLYLESDADGFRTPFEVITDSSQVVEFTTTGGAHSVADPYIHAWYFPTGM